LQSTLLPLPYKEPSQTLFSLLVSVWTPDNAWPASATCKLRQQPERRRGHDHRTAGKGQFGHVQHPQAPALQPKDRIQTAGRRFCRISAREVPYDVPGESRFIKRKDFDDRVDILPVSDPNIFSVAQRITMAQTELQLAQSAPNMHNMYEAYRRMYEAIGVRDIDQILNTQNVDKPKDPASENAQALDGSPLKLLLGSSTMRT